MGSKEPLNELLRFQHETEALMSVAGRLGWDRETMMPHGSSVQRATEQAALVRVIHDRNTDPRIADWLDKFSPRNEKEKASKRLIQKNYEKACRVPTELNATIAEVTSRAHGIWATARQNEQASDFLPILDEIVKLKIEKAEALAKRGNRYDALIDQYEPNISADEISVMFQKLRPTLVGLRKEILNKQKPKAIVGIFGEEVQLKLAKELAAAFGYDFNRGRIDKAVHPFSSGSGNDVRITTRTDPSDPFNCVYSTIHEVGHAIYEQNIEQEYIFSPLGHGVSLGVHESQSRICENQLGRSRPFTGWLFHRMQELFGDFGIDNPEDFYKCVNRLDSGFIRTEADELQYNLHIMLRFDLEKSFISGDLDVRDIENAWNERFEADFGYKIKKPSQGVLQDIHWSAGAFGYFPTYTLGNVYAGCLYQKMRDAVSNLDDALSNGELSVATEWLRKNIHLHGSLFEPKATVEQAAGGCISVEPLLKYLEEKYTDLYGL